MSQRVGRLAWRAGRCTPDGILSVGLGRFRIEGFLVHEAIFLAHQWQQVLIGQGAACEPRVQLKCLAGLLGRMAAAAFERLAGYSERVRTLDPKASAISAGMTHDYVEAIAAGATHLRIGSAITGNRPDHR